MRFVAKRDQLAVLLCSEYLGEITPKSVNALRFLNDRYCNAPQNETHFSFFGSRFYHCI